MGKKRPILALRNYAMAPYSFVRPIENLGLTYYSSSNISLLIRKRELATDTVLFST